MPKTIAALLQASDRQEYPADDRSLGVCTRAQSKAHKGITSRNSSDDYSDSSSLNSSCLTHDLARGRPITIRHRRPEKRLRKTSLKPTLATKAKIGKVQEQPKVGKGDVVGPQSKGMQRVQRMIAYLEDNKEPKGGGVADVRVTSLTREVTISIDSLDSLSYCIYTSHSRHMEGDFKFRHLPGAIFDWMVEHVGGKTFGELFKASATHDRVAPLAHILDKGSKIQFEIDGYESGQSGASLLWAPESSESASPDCSSKNSLATATSLISPTDGDQDFLDFDFMGNFPMFSDVVVADNLGSVDASNPESLEDRIREADISQMNDDPSMTQVALAYGMFQNRSADNEIDMGSVLEASRQLETFGHEGRKTLWKSIWEKRFTPNVTPIRKTNGTVRTQCV